MGHTQALLKLEDVTYTMLLNTDGTRDDVAFRLAKVAMEVQTRANALTLDLQRHLQHRNS